MDFIEQIKKWCREGEEDLKQENRLFAYAQLHAHNAFARWSRLHGRTYRRPHAATP